MRQRIPFLAVLNLLTSPVYHASFYIEILCCIDVVDPQLESVYRVICPMVFWISDSEGLA